MNFNRIEVNALYFQLWKFLDINTLKKNKKNILLQNSNRKKNPPLYHGIKSNNYAAPPNPAITTPLNAHFCFFQGKRNTMKLSNMRSTKEPNANSNSAALIKSTLLIVYLASCLTIREKQTQQKAKLKSLRVKTKKAKLQRAQRRLKRRLQNEHCFFSAKKGTLKNNEELHTLKRTKEPERHNHF